MESQHTTPDLTGGDSPHIQHDVPCIRCGYNLRGLAVQGNCPECGTPLERSMRGEQLVFSDPDWLKTLASGTNWMAAGLLMAVVFGIIGAVVTAASSTVARQPVTQQLLSALGGLIWLIGYWKVTTPDPRRAGQDEGTTARKVARFCLTVSYLVGTSASLMAGAAARMASAGILVGGLSLVSTGIGIVGLVGWIALFVYARQLALRMPDESLAWQTRVVMYGIGTATALTILVALVTLAVVRAASAAPSGATLILAPVGCMTGLAYLVFGLWSLLLLSKYRTRLRSIAQSARTNWEATPAATPSTRADSLIDPQQP